MKTTKNREQKNRIQTNKVRREMIQSLADILKIMARESCPHARRAGRQILKRLNTPHPDE